MKSRRGWWALWAVVLLTVVAVGYPLSLGPALWMRRVAGFPSNHLINIVYRPVGFVRGRSPDWVSFRFQAYLNWWNPPGKVTTDEYPVKRRVPSNSPEESGE